MMVLRRASNRMEFCRFYDIVGYLRPGDAVILNNSRTLNARFTAETAGSKQLDLTLRFNPSGTAWGVECDPDTDLTAGSVIRLQGSRIAAVVLDEELEYGLRLIEFQCRKHDLYTYLDRHGRPLAAVDSGPGHSGEDLASVPGSTEMPTARRHFTAPLVDALRERGVAIHFVTLHTGLSGADHRAKTRGAGEPWTVPAEEYALPADTARAINLTKDQGGTVLAVGTTVVRTLETAGRASLPLRAMQGWTDLCVSPGHAFAVVDALVTNFHSPGSSHVQLAAALAGENLVMTGYAEASRRNLCFGAFGDLTLILPD